MKVLNWLRNFEIERKVNILGLATLAVALMVAIMQVEGCVRGAEVSLYPPDLVGLVLHTNPQDNKEYLRIAARMAYVNSGRAGYNAAVFEEEVDFSFDGGTPYSQRWQSEQQITVDNKELSMKYIREAGPFAVAGGSAVSREVYFAPFPIQCRNGTSNCEGQYRHFIHYPIALHFLHNSKVMNLTFRSHLVGQRNNVLTSSCQINVGPNMIRTLIDKRWISLPCFDPQT